jgi:hypothetical protein
VSFDATQQKQIKRFIEQGKTMRAQKIILRELGEEFGGAAAPSADPMAKLKVTVGNLSEEVGGVLLPYVNRFATWRSGAACRHPRLHARDAGRHRGGRELVGRLRQLRGITTGSAALWRNRAVDQAREQLARAARGRHHRHARRPQARHGGREAHGALGQAGAQPRDVA